MPGSTGMSMAHKRLFSQNLGRFNDDRPGPFGNGAGLSARRSRTGVGQLYGQIKPAGPLKQPTDSGNSAFGRNSTASGKKIVNAIVTKKIT